MIRHFFLGKCERTIYNTLDRLKQNVTIVRGDKELDSIKIHTPHVKCSEPAYEQETKLKKKVRCVNVLEHQRVEMSSKEPEPLKIDE